MLEVGLAEEEGDGGDGNLVISMADDDLTGLVTARRGLIVALGSE
jgi:hypothetical protein